MYKYNNKSENLLHFQKKIFSDLSNIQINKNRGSPNSSVHKLTKILFFMKIINDRDSKEGYSI